MKPAKIAVTLLLGVLIVSGLACAGGGTSSEPTPTPTPTTTATVDENTGSFEIYLAINSSAYDFRDNCNDIENVTLQEKPIISTDEIRSYNWSNHCIELTEEGCHHVATALGEPYHSLNPFVVVANGERIYIGSFYSFWAAAISSFLPPPCPIVSIYEPVGCSLCISGESFQSSNTSNESDVRYDSRIYQALKQAGKLIE